jgi:Holliday junction resolvase RusA-like endonuclease
VVAVVSWHFTIYGKAATKGSTVAFLDTRGAAPRVVTKQDSKRLLGWEYTIGQAARHQARIEKIEKPGAVIICADFQFPRPKSAKRRGAHTVKPDADKLARAVLDGLTDVAFDDDAQVIGLFVVKRYGQENRTDVDIFGADETAAVLERLRVLVSSTVAGFSVGSGSQFSRGIDGCSMSV